MRSVLVCLAAVGLTLAPAPAVAGDGKPLPQGAVTIGLGLGGSFSRGAQLNTIVIGGGFNYFVWGSEWNSLGFGLGLNDTILLYSDEIKAAFPGIASRTPTNILELTPRMIFSLVRTRYFTPYVTAGVGPTIYNNKRGTVGHWIAGPGAVIGLGSRVNLDIGVMFTSVFPASQCETAFELDGNAVLRPPPCNWTWYPRIGLNASFGGGGGGGKRRERRRREREEDEERAREQTPHWDEPAAPTPTRAEPAPPPAVTPPSVEEPPAVAPESAPVPEADPAATEDPPEAGVADPATSADSPDDPPAA